MSLVVALRVLHIVAGAVWVGAVTMFAFFLMPSVAAAGPAGGQVMRNVVERKYPQLMMTLLSINILSGLGLMGWLASTSGGAWFGSPMGRMISLGATLAIVAAVYGTVVSRPNAMRMQKLAADVQAGGGTPTPEQAGEMKAVQGKLARSTRAVAIMLLLAVAAMASGRYMP